MINRNKSNCYVIAQMDNNGGQVYIDRVLCERKDGKTFYGNSLDDRILAFATPEAAIRVGRSEYGHGITNWGVFGYNSKTRVFSANEKHYEQRTDGDRFKNIPYDKPYKLKTADIPELIAESYDTGYGSEREFGG